MHVIANLRQQVWQADYLQNFSIHEGEHTPLSVIANLLQQVWQSLFYSVEIFKIAVSIEIHRQLVHKPMQILRFFDLNIRLIR